MLDDPEYLASVFEWDADVPTVVRPRPPEYAPATRHDITIAAVLSVLGALGAIAFATWGIRQLRAAA